jgi:hypothetical protein
MCTLGEVVEGGLVCAGCCVQARGAGRIWVVEFGQPGVQQVVVGVGAQQGMLEPAVGGPVAADFRTEEGAQITVGEPVREQPWMSRACRSA